jgi:hypothetical protein
MSAPRVIGYDDLHGWLEDMGWNAQDAAEGCASPGLGKDPDPIGAAHEWGRATAFREAVCHIARELRELEWNRG